MKAITVKQPWASLLIGGEQSHETRSWQTQYRGLLLIHAANRPSMYRRRLARDPRRAALFAAEPVPCGCVLGFAVLADCVPAEALDHAGSWAWRLERPTQLSQPFPVRGALGLFEVNDELLRRHLTASESLVLQRLQRGCP
jgi:hypothetical protein